MANEGVCGECRYEVEHDQRENVEPPCTDMAPTLRCQRGVGLADRLLAIGEDAACRLPARLQTIDHGTMLYGEGGLPGTPDCSTIGPSR